MLLTEFDEKKFAKSMWEEGTEEKMRCMNELREMPNEIVAVKKPKDLGYIRGVQMMFSFMLTDEMFSLKVCKH